MWPLILTLWTVFVAAGPQAAPSLQRIVAASNVRLRMAPEPNAVIVSTLSLGTVVTEIEGSPDSAWSRIQTAEGISGWVSTSLTEPFRQSEAVAIYRRILKSRLERDSLNFQEASEAFLLADRIAPGAQSPEAAEFELFRLRALARSSDQILGYDPKDPVQKEWIQQHEPEMAYSEPAGQWFVRADLLWELERRHRGNPVADEIAWEAAGTGIPGECEGYIPCHMTILLMSRARYVDLYPNGPHVDEALDDIDYLLVEVLKPNTPYFMDPREAEELRESIHKMTGILERASSPRKDGMLRRLQQMEEVYGR